jgi:hypothetical protein
MMTPVEFRRNIKEFQNQIGPNAHVTISVTNGRYESSDLALCARVYPQWPGGGHEIEVRDDTFDGLLLKIQEKWSENRAKYRAKMVMDMALAIIRITEEQGACTDAALRGGVFGAADILDFGPEACAAADRMAGRGPFVIVTTDGSNQP